MSAKRIAVAGGVVVVLLAAVFGESTWSYLRTGGRAVREKARGVVPLEFELRRAADAKEDLSEAVRKNVEQFSRQELRVAELERRVSQDEQDTTLKDLKAEIASLRSTVERGGDDAQSGEALLAALLSQARSVDGMQRARESALEQSRAALEATRQKLVLLRSQQERLSAEIDRVRARIEVARANELPAGPHLDLTPSVKEVEAILEGVDSRLNLAERTAENERLFIPDQRSANDSDLTGEELLNAVDKFLERE